MSVKRMATLQQGMASVPQWQLLNQVGFEQMLRQEMKHMGMMSFVLMVLDPYQRPLVDISSGFSQQQLMVYQKNQRHDAYLNYYLQQNLQSKLVYMQEMLPINAIGDAIFHDVLVPTLQLHHSYSGLHPLLSHHYLMLSSHADCRLSPKQFYHLQSLWKSLALWANGWVSHYLFAQKWRQLESSSVVCIEPLTVAERSVLNLLVQGCDGSEIAAKRRVSKETVKTQIKHILHKTGSKHQNQLISRYYMNQLTS
ncbi:helix-turn-helix transcriptional regulator [Thaumasiovibrio sp. DFM-14]|uniref:helix-turn-helix transcriptional regulator n=1 Tax=Thaumasiovibrio sp. DFM-14 TaxID=3384792 RepID=UPI0039A0AB1D